ncbi:MAG: hypothetical protein IPL91_02040 [Hyphomicrobium sp.]|nr:hypothetical protein [Hyphomicrobium sp.]
MVTCSRAKLDPRGSLHCVFPQLVAGPIVRARDFIPQFNEDKTLTNDDIVAGTRAILIGFLYKALFADTLALFVDPVFNDPQSHSAHARVMATFGFYSQIYFDFAGYSLMAIGVARFFG